MRTTTAKNKNINPYPIHVAGPFRTLGVGGIAAPSAMTSRKRVEQQNAAMIVCIRLICGGYQLGRGSESTATWSTQRSKNLFRRSGLVHGVKVNPPNIVV